MGGVVTTVNEWVEGKIIINRNLRKECRRGARPPKYPTAFTCGSDVIVVDRGVFWLWAVGGAVPTRGTELRRQQQRGPRGWVDVVCALEHPPAVFSFLVTDIS